MPKPAVEPRPVRDAVCAVLLHIVAFAGYLYLGYPRRFLLAAVFLLALWLIIIFGLPAALMNASGLTVLTLLVLAAGLVMLIDLVQLAIRRKRRAGQRYQRAWVYVAVAAAVFTAQILMVSPQDLRTLRAFKSPSSSMAPTLEADDKFYVRMHVWTAPAIERSDIVVFTPPHDPQQTYVKRIVGLPGDTVQWIGGVLHVNGAPLTQSVLDDGSIEETTPEGRSYRLTATPHGRGTMDDTPAFDVPEGHVFVAGDNRHNSLDSRTSSFGPVPVENILGTAVMIYWSQDRGRIGRPVR